MAGIGFELRRYLREESLMGLIKAYGYAGLISAGPWVLSILGVMAIGVIGIVLGTATDLVIQFLVSVTYLMAGSLIASSWLQLLLTRFIADRLFEKAPERVLPNLLGAILVTTLISAAMGLALLPLFGDATPAYRLLMLASLIALGNIWVLVIMISGLREHRHILGAFAAGYAVTVAASLALRDHGLEGLLSGFFLGHALLLFLMLGIVVREFPGRPLVGFEFLDRRKSLYSLALTSLFYNLGIWADKVLFWFNPATSEPVIGPLRASLIYDPPIFLAYLSIIPGMAVFLLRMEADFVERYDAFFTAVREGDTLQNIRTAKRLMIHTVRQGLYEIFKVQGVTVLVLILSAGQVLSTFNVSPSYRALFAVDVAAVGVQVLLLAVFNVFFYLDKRRIALALTLLFLVCNLVFTLLSQLLGPAFYGYGFAAAVTITAIMGLSLLNRTLQRLEYETFMLRR